MCLLSSVALRFDSVLNKALWLAYLDLKLADVSPTYVSIVLPQVTTRCLSLGILSQGGTLCFSGNCISPRFRRLCFLLFPSMIVFTLSMQLYELFTVFRLKMLWSLLVAGKQLSSIFENSLPMFLFTFRSYGGLYQIILCFLDLFFASGIGCS